MIGATVFRNGGTNRFEFLELNEDEVRQCDRAVGLYNYSLFLDCLTDAQGMANTLSGSFLGKTAKATQAKLITQIAVALFDKRGVSSFTALQTAFKRKYHELKDRDKNGQRVAAVQEQEGEGDVAEPVPV
jgi:hypothetical protein